jgi:hypothetical protein
MGSADMHNGNVRQAVGWAGLGGGGNFLRLGWTNIPFIRLSARLNGSSEEWIQFDQIDTVRPRVTIKRTTNHLM